MSLNEARPTLPTSVASPFPNGLNPAVRASKWSRKKADIAEMSAFDETCRIYPMRHTDSSQVSTSFLTWSFAIPYRSWIIPSS